MLFGRCECAYSRGLGESVTRGDRRGRELWFGSPAPPLTSPREYTAQLCLWFNKTRVFEAFWLTTSGHGGINTPSTNSTNFVPVLPLSPARWDSSACSELEFHLFPHLPAMLVAEMTVGLQRECATILMPKPARHRRNVHTGFNGTGCE